ncbi:MAG TPA: hypothetical protein VGH98_26365, partial [Gemmatimonadaceae bacterium]
MVTSRWRWTLLLLYGWERPQGIPFARLPALKLAQLAVDVHWEGRGIGRQLVALATVVALQIRERIGCRYLTVDAATL